MRKTWFIFLCIMVMGVMWTYPATAAVDSDVTIDAANMDYDVDAKAVNASGNVVLHGDNLEIRGDQLTYSDDGWVNVPGKAYIKNAQGEFEGEGLHYNVKTQNGEMKNLHGQESGYYFKGEAGNISPDEQNIQHGTITRCDLPKPDYQLHATRIRFRQGHLIVERGYIDVLGIPVLPIFYLNVDLKSLDNWPELRVGSDQEQGVFATALQRFTLTPHWSGYGQIGLGTNEWSVLGAGLTWSPTVDLSFTGAASQEWSKMDKEYWRFASDLNLWKNDKGQRVYLEAFREFQQANDYYNNNALGSDESYWGYLSGIRLNYSPQKDLTMGLGWVDSNGETDLSGVIQSDTRFYGDQGWSPEASLHWKQDLGTDWAFRIESSYRWGSTDDRFLSEQIDLTHYFHCIGTTIGWDGVKKAWQFSVNVRW